MGHVIARTRTGGTLRWGVEAAYGRLEADLQAKPLEGEHSAANALATLSVPRRVDLSTPPPRDATGFVPVRCPISPCISLWIGCSPL